MNGVINVYKPTNVTSFEVVRKIMKICNTKKVGHTGTLDPLASGVLPICVGRGTKIVDFIMSDQKVYNAQLKLGVETDTYDREGMIISEKDVNIDEKTILDVFNSFIGDIEQEPPMYSALKINGKRLYELARQGLVVERAKRKVSIYDINITRISLPYIDFNVTCSKGTYIRSLCYDIGKILNVGGTMWNLERLQSGIFKAEDSILLDKINNNNVQDYVISIEDALKNYDKLCISSRYERLLLNGVKLNNEYVLNKIEFDKLYRVYIDGIKFIGLGMRDDKGFKITKLLV
ncbi:tRNA pseudouridine(55) synthase TruB [Clostridium sp. SYSU_GA19001]|uniref:tRNA pseudouridine(55) synthase TruB n=1 Tax=Clostridium caldaquaticum TaxID=2940653 RepID=UPI002076E0FD|nr:tRNA pseudouridine(55) synthase TruB [Clostridium caldaquaticum]MCM8710630.1 tRNA pseudouridine(55) synthase TruB [Clostridium caldaquaticum]